MDASRRPSRTRPLDPTDPEDDFGEDWFSFGVLTFTSPLHPEHLPRLGNLKVQLAWLRGFDHPWYSDCCATRVPIDEDVTLYTAITATLRAHPALLRELMTIPSVGGSGPH
jgi:hypothetical protein